MANLDNTGFRPLKLISGGDVPVMRFKVAAASGTAMFIGDLVSVVNTGTVTPSTADDGYLVVGCVVGLRDSNAIPVGSPGSSTSNKYLAASTAGYADVALALPDALFVVQGQSGQTPAEADIFASTNHVAGAGDTTTARSGHELNFSDLNTGKQCTIVGLYDFPGNAWDIANTDVVVRFSESYWNPATLVTPT